MQQSSLEISGIRTNVITYGRWVEESPKTIGPEDIILVIPGNPGITGFYRMFLHTIHEKLGYPVWIVGHAGHEMPSKKLDPLPPLKDSEGLYGLQGQVGHKLAFIQKYVPENARLHLIGHSIGSYIILELLKNESVKSRVVDVKLLFPTIENMAETSHGRFLNNFIKPILWLVLFLSWIFVILPQFLQTFLVVCYTKLTKTPKMHIRTIINLIDPFILGNIFFMAFQELDQVHQRNNEVIRDNLGKLKFLYGAHDHWAPKQYCDQLKTDIQHVNAMLCEWDHAFVLRHSRQVGNFVVEWFQSEN